MILNIHKINGHKFSLDLSNSAIISRTQLNRIKIILALHPGLTYEFLKALNLTQTWQLQNKIITIQNWVFDLKQAQMFEEDSEGRFLYTFFPKIFLLIVFPFTKNWGRLPFLKKWVHLPFLKKLGHLLFLSNFGILLSKKA